MGADRRARDGLEALEALEARVTAGLLAADFMGGIEGIYDVGKDKR